MTMKTPRRGGFDGSGGAAASATDAAARSVIIESVSLDATPGRGAPVSWRPVFRPAPHIEHVRYAIRNIVAEAARVEATGKRVLYCNIGDPLKFDFATPPHLVEAVVRAVR